MIKKSTIAQLTFILFIISLNTNGTTDSIPDRKIMLKLYLLYRPVSIIQQDDFFKTIDYQYFIETTDKEYNFPDLAAAVTRFTKKWNLHEIQLSGHYRTTETNFVEIDTAGIKTIQPLRKIRNYKSVLGYEYSQLLLKNKTTKIKPYIGFFFRVGIDDAKSTPFLPNYFATSSTTCFAATGITPRVNWHINERIVADISLSITTVVFGYNRATTEYPFIPERNRSISTFDIDDRWMDYKNPKTLIRTLQIGKE